MKSHCLLGRYAFLCWVNEFSCHKSERRFYNRSINRVYDKWKCLHVIMRFSRLETRRKNIVMDLMVSGCDEDVRESLSRSAKWFLWFSVFVSRKPLVPSPRDMHLTYKIWLWVSRVTRAQGVVKNMINDKPLLKFYDDPCKGIFKRKSWQRFLIVVFLICLSEMSILQSTCFPKSSSHNDIENETKS